MRWFFGLASVGMLAWSITSEAQESKKGPDKAEVTANYLVGGMH